MNMVRQYNEGDMQEISNYAMSLIERGMKPLENQFVFNKEDFENWQIGRDSKRLLILINSIIARRDVKGEEIVTSEELDEIIKRDPKSDPRRNKNGLGAIGVVTDVLLESGIAYERDNVIGFASKDEPFDSDFPRGLSLISLPTFKNPKHVFQFDKFGNYTGKVLKQNAFIDHSECG